MDLAVIPCRPSAFDIAAMAPMAAIIEASGIPGVILLNACPPRSPEIGESRAVLSGFGLSVAPLSIAERRAFARAVASGRAVTEFDAGGKAAMEIRSLWTWLKGAMP